jgi:hypothetical protein
MDWLPAPHWANISCVALSTSASSRASDQSYFVLDSSKGKSSGSDDLLILQQHDGSYVYGGSPILLAASTTLGHHIVCSAVHIDLIQS